MATLNINDANTRVVKFNGNTVNKVILNGTTVWAVRPTPSAASFSVPFTWVGRYSQSSRSGRTRVSTTYPLETVGFVTGSGVAGTTGMYGYSGPFRFAQPSLASGGNGYYVGDTYDVNMVSGVNRTSSKVSGTHFFSTRTRTGSSTNYPPMRMTVNSVTTPLGTTSSTNGDFGIIKTFSFQKIGGYGGHGNLVVGWYTFRRSPTSDRSRLSIENQSSFTVTCSVATPSYKD